MGSAIPNTNYDLALSGIVLAGGQSSRMGRDKALIPVEGVPLLRRVCDVALSCIAQVSGQVSGQVYIVTPWPERYVDILPETCRVVREVPLPEETTPHGPLVGFAQGLAHVETDWVLLLACDLPQLKAEVVQGWLKQLEQTRENAIDQRSRYANALLPRNPKGWEPLCGFYRRECLPSLTEFINQGGRSFQRWLAQHPVQELLVSDTRLFFNCNTPGDLEQLEIQN
ncbi:molybdenum cofactor guanylyltransferase [Moorena sp. SIO3I8]|uniref:molybdenum cofactor guanylyltransferase n=1 Tax=Moorena sp. SIO3I8 TaxID=2607833 RepID=UPI0025FA5FF7|nr:molybdenum cofactor guanylyltransferase [Moorena sp. SIO3I8]